MLGQACAAQGRHDDALTAFRKAAAASPRWAWGLGQGLALAGQIDEARAFAARLAADDPPDPWALAEVHAALGDRDAALGWLEAGYESRRDWMPWMKSNHFFRPLFAEPRFREIERRLDLPYWNRKRSSCNELSLSLMVSLRQPVQLVLVCQL